MTATDFLATYDGDREVLLTLPNRVRVAGLGPVLAALESRPGLAPLAAALARQLTGTDRLLPLVVHGDTDFVRATTASAIAWFNELAHAARNPQEG